MTSNKTASLRRIMGLFHSGSSDVAKHKDRYVGEALLDLHRKPETPSSQPRHRR